MQQCSESTPSSGFESSRVTFSVYSKHVIDIHHYSVGKMLPLVLHTSLHLLHLETLDVKAYFFLRRCYESTS